jgi:acyl carrier protein
MTTDPSLDARVIHLIAQLSSVKEADIKPSHRLREDLGLDSVCSMELLSMLAEELGLDVSLEEAVKVGTVQGAIAMAQRHLAARGQAA